MGDTSPWGTPAAEEEHGLHGGDDATVSGPRLESGLQ